MLGSGASNISVNDPHAVERAMNYLVHGLQRARTMRVVERVNGESVAVTSIFHSCGAHRTTHRLDELFSFMLIGGSPGGTGCYLNGSRYITIEDTRIRSDRPLLEVHTITKTWAWTFEPLGSETYHLWSIELNQGKEEVNQLTRNLKPR